MRGAPASEVIYGPKQDAMTVVIPSDGHHFPAKGVLQGHDGVCAATYKINSNGSETKLPNFVQVEVRSGETIRGIECSGGGYGNPIERDPSRVLHDVMEGWETSDRARDIYGMVLVGSPEDDTLAIDQVETDRVRKELRKSKGGRAETPIQA